LAIGKADSVDPDILGQLNLAAARIKDMHVITQIERACDEHGSDAFRKCEVDDPDKGRILIKTRLPIGPCQPQRESSSCGW
jgi:hypothetical protein